MDRKPTVVIAGASGFIGRWFIEKYHTHYHIIALSRKKVLNPIRESVEWRIVDLYSLSSTTEALKGADFALYLVHSMQPSTRLNQSSFEDTDLLLADNFSRAATKNKLKQIIYVGGIVPSPSKLSTHLQSRLEVEETLGSRDVPVLTLRAGIVIGPGGSSFTMLERLVSRLPVMICPKWTESNCQPVDLRDILDEIHNYIKNPISENRHIDIGGEEVISYRDLLEKTAQILQKRRFFISVPINSVGFSKLWVSLFTSTPRALVSPLVESLKHEMVVDNSQKSNFHQQYSLEETLDYAISHTEEIPKLPRSESRKREKNTVRSVQRLPNPRRKPASVIAKMYQKWLPTLLKYLVRVKISDKISSFRLLGIEVLKLQYVEDRSDQRRQLFYITGGLLAKRHDYGWLEFRNVLNDEYVIGAIHEFVPRLPWYVYVLTQAQVHLWVMKRFGKYLEKKRSPLLSSMI